MTGKATKILSYTFFISLIVLFVLNSQTSTQEWVGVAKSICAILSISTGLVYLVILLYCVIDNKRIDSYLNNDNYKGLIKYCYKKSLKKYIFIPNRVTYYKYLLLLSYLGLDNKEKINEYFPLLKGHEISFPMVSYWRACYNFSNGNLENIKEDIVIFTSSNDVVKKPYKFKALLSILSVLDLFVDGKFKEAKSKLESIDTSTIVMPATLKSIDIIKNFEIPEISNEIKAIENIDE